MSGLVIIDEHIASDGRMLRTHLEASEDGEVVIRCEPGGRLTLPVRALIVTARRYGKPLEAFVPLPACWLELGDSVKVGLLAYRAEVDSWSRDYLVTQVGSDEPLAALSTHMAAALQHLARAWPGAPAKAPAGDGSGSGVS